MNEKELRYFKKLLINEKEKLEKELKYIESSFKEPQSEWGGEGSYESHMGDSGTSTYERESDLSIGENIREMRDDVDKALKRVEDGTYGYCRLCGQAIEKERLKAVPHTDLCVEDKKKVERGEIE